MMKTKGTIPVLIEFAREDAVTIALLPKPVHYLLERSPDIFATGSQI